MQQLSLFEPGPGAPEGPASPFGPVLIAHGARAAEALLLKRLDSLLAEAVKDPRLLARPVRIVVPSRSLRAHLAAALVRRRGRSVAGVSLHTLHGLALSILERAGERLPAGRSLFEILAERHARGEPALRRGLDGLLDGYATVASTVRDLLDAGLEPAHAGAAEEALASDGPRVATRAEVERARALVRVAAATEAALLELGVGRVSTLLTRAAELLATRQERVLPARAVLVHGFAEATGVATDLLEALLRLPGSRLVLDRPPVAGASGSVEVERAYTERLAGRLLVRGRAEVPKVPAPGPPRIERCEAVGTEAEARAVALAARSWIDGGTVPERVAIVARDLGPYRLPLARHLARLGVPFSAIGARGALSPAGRRARALAELLRRGAETPADVWLDAVLPPGRARGPFGAARFDVRLALRALGAGRLSDVAALEVERFLRGGAYPLPIRHGFREPPAGGDGGETEEAEPAGSRRSARARRRYLDGAVLARAVTAARRLADRIAAWPENAPFGDHMARLSALLADDLGWGSTSRAEEERDSLQPALDALVEVANEVPARFRLSRAELRLAVTRALAAAGEPELGGRGGGVQVLTVMEARGRTFDHLAVMGLNRDVFPRAVREDPLLPDDLRRVLQRVLPDVPIKQAGFDEERYLFAQLLSAAPRVLLTWQSADEDGRARPASPLLARLPAGEPEKAPPLWRPGATGPAGLLRPADEHAVLAGLHGSRGRFGRVLELAIAEARGEIPGSPPALDPRALAAARVATLEELDPDLRTPEGRATAGRLGPWFGLTGPRASRTGEPGEVWVTLLENLAACPWQAFLVRRLGIAPTPDPLEALPGVDALLVGNLVHAVLERIVRDAAPEAPGNLPEIRAALAAGRGPVPVPWPAPAELEQTLRREAERVVEEAGIALKGMARALAERVRPFLEVARQVDWQRPLPALGTEVLGAVEIPGPNGGWTIAFKADRVDLVEANDGPAVLRLTDYKSGRPLADAGSDEKRRRRFLAEVESGGRLQAVAYLLGSAGAAGESEAAGRYLFLKPEVDAGERELAVGPADRDFERAFSRAAGAALGAWDAGTFFPRLVEPSGESEPSRCGFCSVAEACLRGDSGARRRLLEWAGRGLDEGERGTGTAEILAVWSLTAKRRNGEPSE